jgi:methylmalonyl-CoA/ethylmalonyl-CoA epimerase
MKIAHIGIAVNDLDAALKDYESLGFRLHKRGVVEEQKVEVISMEIGESSIELIKPTAEGAVSKFLAAKGEGIHHLAIKVDNIEQALAGAKAKGLRLIDERPRIGFGGNKIAFVHPSGMHGVLVELVEEPAQNR